MKKILCSVFLAATVITSCASNVRYFNRNYPVAYPNCTYQQAFDMDRAMCLAMSNGSAPRQQIVQNYYGTSGLATGFSNGYNLVSAVAADSARDDIYKLCMSGRGWYAVEVNKE